MIQSPTLELNDTMNPTLNFFGELLRGLPAEQKRDRKAILQCAKTAVKKSTHEPLSSAIIGYSSNATRLYGPMRPMFEHIRRGQDQEKTVYSILVRHLLRIHNCTSVLVITEGWFYQSKTAEGETNPSEELSKLRAEAYKYGAIKNHPQRIEGLLICEQKGIDGPTTSSVWRQVRDRKNRFVDLILMSESESNHSQDRMAGWLNSRFNEVPIDPDSFLKEGAIYGVGSPETILAMIEAKVLWGEI